MANIDTWNLLPVCTSLNGRNKSAPIACKNESVKVKLEEMIQIAIEILDVVEEEEEVLLV